MMRHRCQLVALLLAVNVGPARADAPPEHLLFAGTQVYARWDGVAAHRDAYAQTVVGKLLSDDLAPLVKSLMEQFPRTLQSGLVDNKLLAGTSPEVLAQMQAEVNETARSLDVLIERGIVVGVEVGQMPSLLQMALGVAHGLVKKQPGDGGNPLLPRIHATLIVPGAAKDAKPLLSLFRLYARANDLELKEEQIANRDVVHTTLGEIRLLAWIEGPHFVVAGTNDAPAALFARLDGPDARLKTAPLFQKLGEAFPFKTDFRAFADLRSLFRIGRQALTFAGPKVGQKVDALGLENIHHLFYVTGFDGATRREVVEFAVPGSRKGLSAIFGREPLSIESLPPLPPDASKWSAHRIDPPAIYDLILNLIDLAKATADDPNARPDPASQALDKVLGISAKSEFVDLLGSLIVTYHSPAEGGLTLGQVVAIEVKDGEKVLQALDQMVQAQIIGNNLRVKKRPHLDAEIRELSLTGTRGVIVPSYTVCKNWLVLSMYPQPIQGFIQRAAGKSPPWQVGERVASLPRPKNCTSWAYNDPRAGAQQLLTFGPIIVGAAQMGSEEPTIEVGTIPSGSIIMQRLTPNVTVMTDDGATIRWETRGGLLLLGDALGVDPIMLFLTAQIFN